MPYDDLGVSSSFKARSSCCFVSFLGLPSRKSSGCFARALPSFVGSTIELRAITATANNRVNTLPFDLCRYVLSSFDTLILLNRIIGVNTIKLWHNILPTELYCMFQKDFNKYAIVHI